MLALLRFSQIKYGAFIQPLHGDDIKIVAIIDAMKTQADYYQATQALK